MAERLSKLQKWILTSCLETANNGRQEMYKYGFLFQSEIISKFFNNCGNKAEVTVSRSLRSMIDKGLLFGFTSRRILDPKIEKIKEPTQLLTGKIKLDIATLEAMKIKREDRNETTMKAWQDKIDNLVKEHGKSASLISPVHYKHERIQLITLTDLGFKTCLMLSTPNLSTLNNKENQ